MTRGYLPEIHDDMLTDMCLKWKRTDLDIADAMGFDKSTISIHRERLGLPRNNRPKLPSRPPEEAVPVPKGKVNPLAVAKLWLGKRLVEKPSGYFLDNVPVNLTSIMRSANKLIKDKGGEQCGHHPDWLV